MPTTIIQTNNKPFKRVKLDPITLDVIENSMFSARWEMDAVLFRTAMSPGIREQGDEFPMIANLEGKMVVGQFGSFIYGFKEAYDGTMEEGDMFLTTDPYACNGAVSAICTSKILSSSLIVPIGNSTDSNLTSVGKVSMPKTPTIIAAAAIGIKTPVLVTILYNNISLHKN